MGEVNQRQRERVEVNLVGAGKVMDTGAPFAFRAMDFSVDGMQLRLEGLQPARGIRLELEFVFDGQADQATVWVSGEIVRLAGEEHAPVCGVRWLENQAPESLEALENFYLECFLGAMD